MSILVFLEGTNVCYDFLAMWRFVPPSVVKSMSWFGLSPFPVTVTTRIMKHFLVGLFQPSFPTVTEKGGHTQSMFMAGQPTPP